MEKTMISRADFEWLLALADDLVIVLVSPETQKRIDRIKQESKGYIW